MSGAPVVDSISPAPSDEEAAAIIAALTQAWPRPAPVATTDTTATNAWRFSGRWWSVHPVSRRGRPAR